MKRGGGKTADDLIQRLRSYFALFLAWLAFGLNLETSFAGEASERPKPVTLDGYLQQLGYGSIPLKRTEQNHLVVDGELGGKKAVIMIDTGNSFTRLDRRTGSRFKTLAELGITLEDPNLGSLSGTNLVLVDELRLGGAKFPNQPAHVTTLGHVATGRYESSTSAYEDCLIGCDFLLRHHCLLDCAGLKLYVRAGKPGPDVRAALENVLRRSGFHETNLEATPALVELCPAKVDGVPLRLLVDTGSVFTLLDDHRGSQSPLAKLPVRGTMLINQGIGKRGGTPIYTAELESFQLDGVDVSLKKTRLGVTDLITFNLGRPGAQLQNADGLLGADVLAIVRGLIDLENRKLWLVTPKGVIAGKGE